ncbi:MAG: hypothetical protein PHU23_03215 [Dehalococcoidales bacterium]|nr:hypothetical protein [Dehalococcoidales bacterium]
MTREEIVTVCEEVGCEDNKNEKIAMERTKQYLERSFKDEEEIDTAFITTVAGSYFDGVLDTLKECSKKPTYIHKTTRRRGKLKILKPLPSWLQKIVEFQNNKRLSCPQMIAHYFPGMSHTWYKLCLYHPEQLPAVDMLRDILNNFPQYQETIITGIKGDKIACPAIYKGALRSFPKVEDELIEWIKAGGWQKNHE